MGFFAYRVFSSILLNIPYMKFKSVPTSFVKIDNEPNNDKFFQSLPKSRYRTLKTYHLNIFHKHYYPKNSNKKRHHSRSTSIINQNIRNKVKRNPADKQLSSRSSSDCVSIMNERRICGLETAEKTLLAHLLADAISRERDRRNDQLVDQPSRYLRNV